MLEPTAMLRTNKFIKAIRQDPKYIVREEFTSTNDVNISDSDYGLELF